MEIKLGSGDCRFVFRKLDNDECNFWVYFLYKHFPVAWREGKLFPDGFGYPQDVPLIINDPALLKLVRQAVEGAKPKVVETKAGYEMTDEDRMKRGWEFMVTVDDTHGQYRRIVSEAIDYEVYFSEEQVEVPQYNFGRH